MSEELGVLRPAVPAQEEGQKAQDHEDPVQALGIGDGHVQERAGQQIGQGDAPVSYTHLTLPTTPYV